MTNLNKIFDQALFNLLGRRFYPSDFEKKIICAECLINLTYLFAVSFSIVASVQLVPIILFNFLSLFPICKQGKR